MPSDQSTTIQSLKDRLLQFRDERDWRQFHDPKNLAEAISVESAELLELFLWKTPQQIDEQLSSDCRFQEAVQEELADVLCFVLSLANVLDLDMSLAVCTKIEQNGRKYPVDKARGNATKYDQL